MLLILVSASIDGKSKILRQSQESLVHDVVLTKKQTTEDESEEVKKAWKEEVKLMK